MSAEGLRAVVSYLRQLTDPGSAVLSDTELLDRYAQTRDEAAFELLLKRHGPMVLGVCQRVLRDAADVEDAFQATFLAFIRKADDVRHGTSVGAWLYQVAYRIALRARASIVPREKLTTEPAVSEACDDLIWRDLRPVLDEEVCRLPARYRAPVILCYLESYTHAEAARELSCPKGTIAIRLLRARKLLQTRLARRGITLAGGGLLVTAVTPPVSATLVDRTLRLAFGGTVPDSVMTLTKGATHTMPLTYLKATIAVFLLSTGLLGTGVVLVKRFTPSGNASFEALPQTLSSTPSRKASSTDSVPQAAPSIPSPKDKEVMLVRIPSPRDGMVLAVATELKEGEKVPEDRRFIANIGYLYFRDKDGNAGRPWQEGDPLEPEKIFLKKIKKEYKLLRIGDEVQPGQTVALVDSLLELNDLAIKIAALEASESERLVSLKTKEEAERRVMAMASARQKVPGSVSQDDYQGAILTARRYAEEEIAKRSAIVKTQQELIRAQTAVDMCQIRCQVRGVIKDIYKETGDGVKTLEAVLVVEVPYKTQPKISAPRPEKMRSVCGSREGILILLGTEIKAGEVVAPEQIIKVETGTASKSYRKLHEDDTVEAGQLVASIDDRLARSDVAIKEAALEASETEHRAAVKTKEEAERRVMNMKSSMQKVPGSVSEDDYQGAILTARRYAEEAISRAAAIKVRQAELEKAKAVLTTYEIRSPVRGVVREILKFPGEAVQAQEPVIRLSVPQGP